VDGGGEEGVVRALPFLEDSAIASQIREFLALGPKITRRLPLRFKNTPSEQYNVPVKLWRVSREA
jgi:hypothetical protein